ncbi:D-alanyl-lipoteichoic acid acyltransferase DltB (MBOAT superfamily) [Algoriphagus sp. 4150]|uniref:MBOAT family O-acyltransferase n=1 Tax=Algoriphagus sp. 4150 TaxID=2817756 RepID=UPI002862EA94|nr:MBOAT family O-acyltransferase [Algoriphagus sp. 4150]MDR7128022.1 D-alanyl-lipoteichoic acid acyltransferase DltB (MBOAT superfamily) [Algoriphagus sp. 4150]
MPFNSLPFIAFFLILTIFFYSAPLRFRHTVLLFFSLVYFLSFGLVSILALLSISGLGYIFIQNLQKQQLSSRWRVLSVFVILATWWGYKYLGDTLAIASPFDLIEYNLDGWLLHPVGISFYSLQLLGVILDPRSSAFPHSWRFRDVLLFLGFLPQSMAGPIHRQQELIPQLIHTASGFQPSNIFIGVKYLVWGYVCKLIAGDKLAILAGLFLDNPEKSNGLTLLVGSGFYAFQIYFDFYGYSLIAIGLGRILGIKVKVNFRHPYRSISFKEFWRRWHISLSTWFRDYVYIPLGGNRRGYLRWTLTILATFIVSGLWHGFATNFLLWGAVHGLLLVLEGFILDKMHLPKNTLLTSLLSFVRWPIFFLTLSMTWLIFRTADMQTLGDMIKKIFSVSDWTFTDIQQLLFLPNHLFYLLLFMMILAIEQWGRLDQWLDEVPENAFQYGMHGAGFTICGLLLILFGGLSGQEFLYFRF